MARCNHQALVVEFVADCVRKGVLCGFEFVRIAGANRRPEWGEYGDRY